MTRHVHVTTSALGVDYSFAPVTEDVEWQNQGLCRSGRYDPNLWYPEAPQVERKSAEPIQICWTCPVIMQCRTWALTKHEIYGVWGGCPRTTGWPSGRAAPPSAAICAGSGERARTPPDYLQDTFPGLTRICALCAVMIVPPSQKFATALTLPWPTTRLVAP